MKKSHIIIVSSVVLFLVTGLSLAQEGKMDSQNRNSSKNIRENVKEKRQEVKTTDKEKKQEVGTEVKETREEIKIRTREATQKFKKDLEQKREELKTKVEQKKDELKTKVETKREELKQRLEKIKDEKKKQAVERIDRHMDALNDRMLKHYVNVLDKLSEVLVRISERADRAEERGVDVSVVRTAIDTANGAITAAKSAVETQSGKTYTIQVGTESTLKVDVGKARQALHNDLVAVRSTVKAAHEAVRNAATTLAQLPRPILTPEATGSPNSTPTVEN